MPYITLYHNHKRQDKYRFIYT